MTTLFSRSFRGLLILALLMAALSAGAATPRIMLVGDSWAWFMWLNRSFQAALQRAGLDEYEEVGLYTTVPGSTSLQWNNPQWLENIDKEFARNPTIDIVHISLGGNGFLRQWNKEMSTEARDKLFQSITDEIEVVVKHCLALSPAMRVAICGYDYVNDARRNSTVPELNQAGMILAGMKREMAAKYERAEYIQSYGLMQHHFGHAPDFGPGEAPLPGQLPDFDPWPGGNKEFGNPPEAMLDKIHLSPEGYAHLADLCVETLYARWLKAPILAEAAAR